VSSAASGRCRAGITTSKCGNTERCKPTNAYTYDRRMTPPTTDAAAARPARPDATQSKAQRQQRLKDTGHVATQSSNTVSDEQRGEVGIVAIVGIVNSTWIRDRFALPVLRHESRPGNISCPAEAAAKGCRQTVRTTLCALRVDRRVTSSLTFDRYCSGIGRVTPRG
jgi:hypothetical protein